MKVSPNINVSTVLVKIIKREKIVKLATDQTFLAKLDQDFIYGEILAGRPGAWLVKKKMFYMLAITKCKKRPHNEIKNYFQKMFHFYDSLYGL